MNGLEIGEVVFDGQANKVEKFAVKPGLLVEGENVISLESQRGGNDRKPRGSCRVTYAHRYESDENSLRMTRSGRERDDYRFTTPSIRILDITNPAQVGEVAGTIRKQEDGYAVTVNVGGQGTRRCWRSRGSSQAACGDQAGSSFELEKREERGGTC